MQVASPESYLSLLSGPQGERSSQIERNEKQRTLRFLNALALLIVSRPKREVYAVGLQLPDSSGTPAKLFVAGNESTVPEKTESHMREICEELVAISALQTTRDTSPLIGRYPEAVAQRGDAFLLKIIEFCNAKVSSRWGKRDANWDQYIVNYRTLLNHYDNAHIEMFDKLIAAIEMGYEALQQKNYRRAAISMEGIALIMNKAECREMFHQTDLFLSARGRWLLERYIDKITDHIRSLNYLVGVAASKRFQPLFSRAPYVTFVHSTPRQVTIDIEPIRRRLPSVFEGAKPFVPQSRIDALEKRYTATAHCELVLLAHFLANPSSQVQEYIGVSKLSCFGCGLGIEAINEEFPDFPKFKTSGAHAKNYPSYVYPVFSDEIEKENRIKSKLIELLEQHFKKADASHRVNLSDSTTTSTFHYTRGKDYSMNKLDRELTTSMQ